MPKACYCVTNNDSCRTHYIINQAYFTYWQLAVDKKIAMNIINTLIRIAFHSSWCQNYVFYYTKVWLTKAKKSTFSDNENLYVMAENTGDIIFR